MAKWISGRGGGGAINCQPNRNDLLPQSVQMCMCIHIYNVYAPLCAPNDPMFLFSTQNRIYIYYFGINLVAFSHLCRICRVRRCLCIHIRPNMEYPTISPCSYWHVHSFHHSSCCWSGWTINWPSSSGQRSTNVCTWCEFSEFPSVSPSFLHGESAKYMACTSFVIVHEMKCT